VSPVRYEIRFYIPKEDILHSRRNENVRSYINDMMIVMIIGKITILRQANLEN
jgi:hypothetical protein